MHRWALGEARADVFRGLEDVLLSASVVARQAGTLLLSGFFRPGVEDKESCPLD
jgi:hypothetical protein